MIEKAKLVLKKSKIHGKGVFVKVPVEKGVDLLEYRGKRRRWYSCYDDGGSYICLMYSEEGYVIDPRIEGNLARFINHSCEPNCLAVLIGKRVFIETLRDLEANEEITMDYGLTCGCKPKPDDFRRFHCKCGNQKCRGTYLSLAN